MKSIIFVSMALAAAMSVAPSAHADPAPAASVRVGVGARTSIDWLGEYAGSVAGAVEWSWGSVELAAEQSFARNDDGSPSRSLGASLAVLPVIARRGAVALQAGLSASVAWYHDTWPYGDVNGRDLAVAAPVRVTVDVAPWLSLHAQSSIGLVHESPGYTVWGPDVSPGSAFLAGFTAWF